MPERRDIYGHTQEHMASGAGVRIDPPTSRGGLTAFSPVRTSDRRSRHMARSREGALCRVWTPFRGVHTVGYRWGPDMACRISSAEIYAVIHGMPHYD